MDHKFNVINNRYALTLFESGNAIIQCLFDININNHCRWETLNGKLCLRGGIMSSMGYTFHEAIQKDYENYLKEMVVSE